MNKYNKNKIKTFVASGRAGRAIDLLLQYRSSDSDISNEIISLSARYKNYLRAKHGNLQYNQTLDIELNKINNSILHIIEDETELRMIFFNTYTNIAIGTSLIVVAIIFGYLQFNPQKSKIKNQNNISNQNNSVNTTNFNNQTINQNNFIDKSTYNSQTINQIIPATTTSETKSNAQSDIAKAVSHYNNAELDLALGYINKYNSPPSDINSTFFYTLKANIFFYKTNYDSSYYYHLLAFNSDKNSKYLDLPKIRGLTYAYSNLKTNGYSLKDLKNIEMNKRTNMIIYDLGFRKIEMHNGWILLEKSENNEDFLKMVHELKMDLPQPK